MTLFFKLLGATAMLLSAGALSNKYAKHLTRRAGLARGFSELLLHIKNKVSVYLAPPSELVGDFRCDVLEEVGYLKLARELGSPKDAYLSMKNSLFLAPESEHILTTYFNSFGVAYKDELIRATEVAEISLRREAESEEEALPREKKLSRTIIFAIALGAIILFV